MDWNRTFNDDTQMRSIIDQFNEVMVNLSIPDFDRFSVMNTDERNEMMTDAHLTALKAAACAIKRLLDTEEMPDRSIEMRINRMITADRLWHQRIVPFRIMIELLTAQKERPDLFKDNVAKKQ